MNEQLEEIINWAEVEDITYAGLVQGRADVSDFH